MTNEEKAKEIVSQLKFGTSISPIVNDSMYDAVLEMAKWKDRQFREYLEKKINGLTTITTITNSMVTIKRCDEMVDVFTQIINELFKEEKK